MAHHNVVLQSKNIMTVQVPKPPTLLLLKAQKQRMEPCGFPHGSEWPNPGTSNTTTLPVDPGGPRGPCVPTPGLPFSPFSPGKPKEIVLIRVTF